MSRVETDLVVLGGGPGGYVAAIRAAQLGVDCVLVEAGDLGGVCLNEGCVPSKALIHDSVEVAGDSTLGLLDDARRGERFAASLTHREKVIRQLRTGVGALLQANRVRVVSGTGSFRTPGELDVVGGSATGVSFRRAIVATGSQAVIPEPLVADGRFVVTAREVLGLSSLPSKVHVVGAGYIGLELASALTGFGVDVTVVEATDRMLVGVDADVTRHLRRRLTAAGIDVRLETVVASAGEGRICLRDANGTSEHATDLVVVAAGRTPRSAGLGLETIGLGCTASGHIDVDEQLRTAVANVFAVGDVTPGPALAHRAMSQGRVAAEVIAGHSVRFQPAAIPAIVFTTPEVAVVGLRLDEALDRGLDAEQFRFPLTANARALTTGTDGFGLIVHERSSGLVLGVHLIGDGVGELISTATLAIEMGAVVEDLAGTIFPHPTLSEMFGELADGALGRAIHTLPN